MFEVDVWFAPFHVMRAVLTTGDGTSTVTTFDTRHHELPDLRAAE